jgi:ketosteroid isomerase-like protein
MRSVVVVALTLALAMPMFAKDAADEVRDAETAFAKAFADRDQEKFFTYVADDAHFIGRKALNNKKEVVAEWSNYFKGDAPFSWSPERVFVNAKGDLGLSSGPVYSGGKHVMNFSSVWQKQADGRWLVIFDGPGSQICEPK